MTPAVFSRDCRSKKGHFDEFDAEVERDELDGWWGERSVK
jgi:hypothetical protein